MANKIPEAMETGSGWRRRRSKKKGGEKKRSETIIYRGSAKGEFRGLKGDDNEKAERSFFFGVIDCFLHRQGRAENRSAREEWKATHSKEQSGLTDHLSVYPSFRQSIYSRE